MLDIYRNRSSEFIPFSFYDRDGTQRKVDYISEVITQNDNTFWVFDDECLLLYELAYGYHNKPETEGFVLDFGTHRGASSSIMGSAVRDSINDGNSNIVSPVMTVDLYPYRTNGEDDFHTDNYLQARESFIRSGLIHTDVCFVMYDDRKFFSFWNNPIRIAFIDTSHDYVHTKIEIDNIMPRILDDGWVVFHDYSDEEWGDGVKRAINEFLDTQEVYDLDVYFVEYSIVCFHVKGRCLL